MEHPYNKEEYWDRVAREIDRRDQGRLIAGDDEPYYRYKRKLFLELFRTIPFQGKKVLEIGSGPGGNLEEAHALGAEKVTGADVSAEMVKLATGRLRGKAIDIVKVNGTDLPFENDYVDLTYTSTVLQHNTNEEELKKLIAEICRVSRTEVILFERIEKTVQGHSSNLGRPVSYYQALLAPHGFQLEEVKFLPLQVSYYVSGAIRKLFNPGSRKEGEALTKTALAIQNLTLPFTRVLDKIIPCKRDVGMLRFKARS